MNKKTKIVLNAMVGNEARTIERMLSSVYPYIDYWVIQCNGSDETKSIIENYFREKNIPGLTYEIEWNFPGWNRDHALQKCLQTDHGCDWILRMDADERLQVDEDFDWSVLDNTSVQSWNVTAHAADTNYFRTWMWNAKLPWFFQHDKRHETIHLPEIGEGFQRLNLPFGFRHLVSQDGETWFVPRKFLKDALELEIDKVVGYKVLDDPYHLWYIAKSYADCYGNPSELPFGRTHSEEYARRSIWYFHRYFESVHGWSLGMVSKKFDEMAYFANICIAHAYEFLNENNLAIDYFKAASLFSENRNENYVYLCFLLEKLGKYDEIIQILDFIMKPERTNPFPNQSFLIENRAYSNTGTFLSEYKEKILKKSTEHVADMSSVKFEF